MIRRAGRGLSLIELVAAMAIFALVAVMGTQALVAMLRLRGDLAGRSDRSAGLARAAFLLRRDLAAAVLVVCLVPGGPPS